MADGQGGEINWKGRMVITKIGPREHGEHAQGDDGTEPSPNRISLEVVFVQTILLDHLAVLPLVREGNGSLPSVGA